MHQHWVTVGAIVSFTICVIGVLFWCEKLTETGAILLVGMIGAFFAFVISGKVVKFF